MLRTVPMPEPKRLDDYRESAGEEAVERLAKAAAPLKGSRMVHVSSTAFGGGVAELLYTHIALLQDLGIEAEWQLIEGSDEFFQVTKLVHNALQGMGVPWTESFEQTYLERIRANAERFESDADYVFIHDPQPLAMLTFLEESEPRHGEWIWRCHIDLSQPMEQVWSFLTVHAASYDAAVFTLDEYVRSGLGPRIAVIPPSIDPLSPKNSFLDDDAVTKILDPYGIDRNRPLLTQVSRFDPWKDPLGVIDAYRIVKRHVPDAQLALVGSMAHDDPEAWHFLEMAEEHRAGDPDVHLLTNVQGAVGPIEVNAFQRASDVVIQKSIKEGFGLTASEAMWKERPVVAGKAGGLRIQVQDGVNGYLVDSPDQCAGRILDLLRDDELRRKMGEAGREVVRDKFLSIRELTDYLELLGSL
ncbi:MAG: glycosyltransferase [Actinomycetota bacterium]